MAQATKTWKIGEYAKGGVITVEIKGKVVIIIGKDWDYNAGTTRNSNQSNAKEFTRGSVLANEDNSKWKIDRFLNELTTSYYAGQILDWIKSKVELHTAEGWR